MKILHTADWHLGKVFHNHSLVSDQEHVLQQFIAIAKDTRPDVILIAGDIYDRSVPPKEAVALFDNILETLILDLKIPVIAIAGNHDSPDRIDFGRRLFRAQHLYISGRPDTQPQPVIVSDKYGKVYFYPFPYIDPINMHFYLHAEGLLPEGSGLATHGDLFEWFVGAVDAVHPFPERAVCVAHPFVQEVSQDLHNASDAERRIAVGGQYQVSKRVFAPFHYTALGHLHSRQALSGTDVHYSGSILKYSFSETDHQKSVTLVELDERGHTRLNFIDLKPLREVRKISGIIEDQRFIPDDATASPTDFLWVRLRNTSPVLHALPIVQEQFSHAVSIENKMAKPLSDALPAMEGADHPSPVVLFERFYEEMMETSLPKAQRQIIQEIIQAMDQEE